jgi:hypothetical protein
MRRLSVGRDDVFEERLKDLDGRIAERGCRGGGAVSCRLPGLCCALSAMTQSCPCRTAQK